MLLEVRTYRIKHGMRDAFVELFDGTLADVQRRFGMTVLGQFTSVDDRDTFVWLRRFDDEEQRAAQCKSLYEDATWTRDFAPLAHELIEDVHVQLVTATPGSRIQ